MNPYNILGVQEGASESEIKKAFREKAKEFHPDVNPRVDAQEIFIKLFDAYECLRKNGWTFNASTEWQPTSLSAEEILKRFNRDNPLYRFFFDEATVAAQASWHHWRNRP